MSSGSPDDTAGNLAFSLEEIASSRKEMSDSKDIPNSLSNPHLRPGAPWGFVVVRAIYGASSDVPWARMLDLLRSVVADALELGDDSSLLQRFELTVIEDEATLNSADSYAVRRAFRSWVAEDLPPRLCNDYLEQYGGTMEVRAKLLSNDPWHDNHPVACAPPRWQYCLFVDEDCLRSLTLSPDCPTFKFLTTNWELESQEVPMEEFTYDWVGGETDSGTEDVGWMYLGMDDIVHAYDRCIDPLGWETFYERPYKSWVDDVYGDKEGVRSGD